MMFYDINSEEAKYSLCDRGSNIRASSNFSSLYLKCKKPEMLIDNRNFYYLCSSCGLSTDKNIVKHFIYYIFQGTSDIIAGPSKGKSCHFPFEYKGNMYSKCITEDSSGHPWCSSTNQFSHDSFGYCFCPFNGKNITFKLIVLNKSLKLWQK